MDKKLKIYLRHLVHFGFYFQRRDDDVLIALLKPISEIKKYVDEETKPVKQEILLESWKFLKDIRAKHSPRHLWAIGRLKGSSYFVYLIPHLVSRECPSNTPSIIWCFFLIKFLLLSLSKLSSLWVENAEIL